MSQLDTTFATLRKEGRRALIPFLMSSFPDAAGFRAALLDAAQCADVIEIGIPFSDPLADGSTIQAAATRALAGGATLASTFALLDKEYPKDGPPLVFMISMNQVLAAGCPAASAARSGTRDCSMFFEMCAARNVAGVIIPDLPFEEAMAARDAAQSIGVALIPMIAPTTDPTRAAMIAGAAKGFLYLISVTGVTGTRGSFPPETFDYVRRIRALTDAPLCIGFGISEPSQIEELRQEVDGFIVGSALIAALSRGERAADFLAPLRAACDRSEE